MSEDTTPKAPDGIFGRELELDDKSLPDRISVNPQDPGFQNPELLKDVEVWFDGGLLWMCATADRATGEAWVVRKSIYADAPGRVVQTDEHGNIIIDRYFGRVQFRRKPAPEA